MKIFFNKTRELFRMLFVDACFKPSVRYTAKKTKQKSKPQRHAFVPWKRCTPDILFSLRVYILVVDHNKTIKTTDRQFLKQTRTKP